MEVLAGMVHLRGIMALKVLPMTGVKGCVCVLPYLFFCLLLCISRSRPDRSLCPVAPVDPGLVSRSLPYKANPRGAGSETMKPTPPKPSAETSGSSCPHDGPAHYLPRLWLLLWTLLIWIWIPALSARLRAEGRSAHP